MDNLDTYIFHWSDPLRERITAVIKGDLTWRDFAYYQLIRWAAGRFMQPGTIEWDMLSPDGKVRIHLERDTAEHLPTPWGLEE